jgi:hypothetical protein
VFLPLFGNSLVTNYLLLSFELIVIFRKRISMLLVVLVVVLPRRPSSADLPGGLKSGTYSNVP